MIKLLLFAFFVIFSNAQRECSNYKQLRRPACYQNNKFNHSLNSCYSFHSCAFLNSICAKCSSTEELEDEMNYCINDHQCSQINISSCSPGIDKCFSAKFEFLCAKFSWLDQDCSCYIDEGGFQIGCLYDSARKSFSSFLLALYFFSRRYLKYTWPQTSGIETKYPYGSRNTRVGKLNDFFLPNHNILGKIKVAFQFFNPLKNVFTRNVDLRKGYFHDRDRYILRILVILAYHFIVYSVGDIRDFSHQAKENILIFNFIASLIFSHIVDLILGKSTRVQGKSRNLLLLSKIISTIIIFIGAFGMIFRDETIRIILYKPLVMILTVEALTFPFLKLISLYLLLRGLRKNSNALFTFLLLELIDPEFLSYNISENYKYKKYLETEHEEVRSSRQLNLNETSIELNNMLEISDDTSTKEKSSKFFSERKYAFITFDYRSTDFHHDQMSFKFLNMYSSERKLARLLKKSWHAKVMGIIRKKDTDEGNVYYESRFNFIFLVRFFEIEIHRYHKTNIRLLKKIKYANIHNITLIPEYNKFIVQTNNDVHIYSLSKLRCIRKILFRRCEISGFFNIKGTSFIAVGIMNSEDLQFFDISNESFTKKSKFIKSDYEKLCYLKDYQFLTLRDWDISNYKITPDWKIELLYKLDLNGFWAYELTMNENDLLVLSTKKTVVIDIQSGRVLFWKKYLNYSMPTGALLRKNENLLYYYGESYVREYDMDDAETLDEASEN